MEQVYSSKYSICTAVSESFNSLCFVDPVDVERATVMEEDHKAVSSLPGDQYQSGRSQDIGSPHSESSPGHSNSSPLHSWPREEPSSSQWWAGGSRCERLYQDRQGGLHVAHQPPDYTDDHDDSHPSESLSDHDHHHRHRHHSGEPGRLPVHPWTSSGSESAYETIRERHRHVDEALASSFEFYSTSPRDARLLGYVSSEGHVCNMSVCYSIRDFKHTSGVLGLRKVHGFISGRYLARLLLN